jgi:chromosome partitioning protein
MPKIVAVINQKGGVGKTTTVANLGAAIARKGSRVLLVDVDHQANLTSHFGWKKPSDLPTTIFDVLVKDGQMQDAIRTAEKSKVDVVCSDIRLAGADLELGPQVGREFILRRKLQDVAGGYDWILMDCPPSLGVLSMNAIVAAKEILIPLQTEYFALQGMDHLLRFIQVVQDRLNKEVSVSWIVPCRMDSRRVIDREVIEHVQKHFPGKITGARIRQNVALVDAGARGIDIFNYEPKSHGAADYAALADEVMR